MFMIKYVYSSFADTYFLFYCDTTTKLLSLMCKVLALSTLKKSNYNLIIVITFQFYNWDLSSQFVLGECEVKNSELN
jgi:hypothetical protein